MSYIQQTKAELATIRERVAVIAVEMEMCFPGLEDGAEIRISADSIAQHALRIAALLRERLKSPGPN